MCHGNKQINAFDKGGMIWIECDSCHGTGEWILEDLDEKSLETKVHNTTVQVKAHHFKKFADLISNQFNHGGDKYKLQGFEDREATDVISSIFGGGSQFDWILGTMMKYLFRFKNYKREKDLLKVATYCYILWLKQGNHLKLEEEHDEDTAKNTKINKGTNSSTCYTSGFDRSECSCSSCVSI